MGLDQDDFPVTSCQHSTILNVSKLSNGVTITGGNFLRHIKITVLSDSHSCFKPKDDIGRRISVFASVKPGGKC